MESLVVGSIGWPPPFQGMVAAPAGEPASSGWRLPTTGQLDWGLKALQVTFLGLALLGLLVILGVSGPRAVLKGAAKKHAVA
jgi:hypothetical protein